MEEQKFETNESIQLIAQMISNTQKRVENNFGQPFIICGYSAFFISLIIWLCYTFLPEVPFNWSYLWLLIGVVTLASAYPAHKKRKLYAKSFIDQVLEYIWIVIGLVSLIVGFISFIWLIPVFFLIPVLLSMGIILTGLIIQYPLITICGLISSFLAFICLWCNNSLQPLLFGSIFILLMVVPGHALNRKSKESH